MCASSLLGFALAARAAQDALSISAPLYSKTPTICEGRIVGEPVRKRWGIKFDVDLLACDADGGRIGASGRARASARYEFVGAWLQPGDIIRAPFTFKRPREFKNPGSFSYTRYLMSRGIGAVASVRGKLKRLRRSSGFGPAISVWRAGLRRIIRESVPKREAEVVEALATGRKAEMDEGVRESFSRAGIAHLLAISGLHAGYVALMIYLLVRFTLGRAPNLVARIPLARLSAAVTLPLIWLYISFVGFPMSAVRAGLMLSVYLVGVIAGLRQDGLTTLAAAVIAVLVVWPLAVLDISFQLSVAAVIGIIVAGLPLIRGVDRSFSSRGTSGKLVRRFSALVIISVTAALFTAPLVAYHFGTFTALGPVTNLIAVPLVALGLMPVILLATLLAPIVPWAAGYAFWISGLLSGVLIDVAEIASNSGAFLTGNVSPSAGEMALAYAVIALVFGLGLTVSRRFPTR